MLCTVSPGNRSAGVIIEGFPSTTDEAEFMATKGNYIDSHPCLMITMWFIIGLFPDAAVILKVGDQDVVNRILPYKMAIWRRKRDKRLAIREAKKQKRIKEWVSFDKIIDRFIRVSFCCNTDIL